MATSPGVSSRSPPSRVISFSAKPREITGYLGPNGSGKSTTMKMITGLIEASNGEILFERKIYGVIHEGDEGLAHIPVAHGRLIRYISIIRDPVARPPPGANPCAFWRSAALGALAPVFYFKL